VLRLTSAEARLTPGGASTVCYSAGVDQVHSPMCQITWTETVRGVERFAFEHDFPIELPFGMHIEPAFWTSAEHIAANLVFQVFLRHLSGEVLRYNHLEQLSAADLPGAPGPDLWVGMALGQAFQITQASGVRFSGVFDFRPHVFFQRSGLRSGLLLGEFAVAPERHSFVMLQGRNSDGFEFTSERFVGGPGRPS
jgi:hypothetical protein